MENKIYVASNKNPDLDGYACAFGYAELLNKIGKISEHILTGRVDDETMFILDMIKQKPIYEVDENIKIEKLILVDTSNLRFLNLSVDPKNLIEIIDHRTVNDSSDYPWAKIQIELVGSCATLITEKFQEAGVEPSRESAYLLYGAIVSNTINFKNKVTVQRDLDAAKYLIDKIEIDSDFAEKMFRARTNIDGENLSRYIHNDFAEHSILGRNMTVFQMEIVGTDDLIANRLDEIKSIIQDVIKGQKLDYCFLNIIDTLEAKNYILAADSDTEKILSKILNLNFVDKLAKTDYIIMRKEIMAKIKDYLSNE
ncbi:MAG: DHH family phosphoesterase [Candidatus Berkelbacteria bacterium]